jgi:hypothetical protein
LLLEHAHYLVDDSEKDQVIIIVFFQRAEGFGMCVERGKITGFVMDDKLSPVATAAGS